MAKNLKSKKKQERTANIVTVIVLILLSLVVMLPIWWIFRSSLMSNGELFEWPPSFLPKRWLFSNYAKTLEFYPFWKYFKNTMTIIIPAVLGGTVTATLGGYAFARLRFPGKKFLFSLCLGSMLLPTMVTPVHHVDAGAEAGGFLSAADPALFLRRWRVQYLPDPPVHFHHPPGA